LLLLRGCFGVWLVWQVIEVLMNYKRTVQDFQRCDSHATTQ